VVEEGHERRQEQPQSVESQVCSSAINSRERPDLHRTLIDQETIKLHKGFVCTSGFGEDDSGNSTADTIGSICNSDTLDSANGFDKVFLKSRKFAPS
jgi:hypothetical protein